MCCPRDAMMPADFVANRCPIVFARAGIHIAFFSAAHRPEDIDQVFDAFRASFLALREDGVI